MNCTLITSRVGPSPSHVRIWHLAGKEYGVAQEEAVVIRVRRLKHRVVSVCADCLGTVAPDIRSKWC